MEANHATCNVCQRSFEVRFRYQMRAEAAGTVHLCSTRCQREYLLSGAQPTCTVCAVPVAVEYPHQVVAMDDHKAYFCSFEHRQAWDSERSAIDARAEQKQTRIAVFNHKGGTGKTTTSVSLAAALSALGKRVLLIDADGQGNVSASLGLTATRTLYHIVVQGTPVRDAIIPVTETLHVLPSNETLAALEIHLAQKTNRERMLRDRVAVAAADYDVVILDCAPALSLLNQNTLVFADRVVVPVACDYLSLIGVRQVLKTLKNVQTHLRHDVQLLGVVPTFYDVRNRISRDALTALQEHFGAQCFMPIRVNTKLKEAPSVQKTVFDYARDSSGAYDYLELAKRVLQELEPKRSESEHAAVFSRPARVATPMEGMSV